VLEVIESFGGVLPDWSSTSGGTVIAASVLKRQPLAGKIAVVLVMVKLVEAGVSIVGVNLNVIGPGFVAAEVLVTVNSLNPRIVIVLYYT